MFGSSSTRATVAGFTPATLLQARRPGKRARRNAQVVPHSAFSSPQPRRGACAAEEWYGAMRKIHLLPIALSVLAVLFVLVLPAFSQDPALEAEIAAAADADATPDAIGLPIPD